MEKSNKIIVSLDGDGVLDKLACLIYYKPNVRTVSEICKYIDEQYECHIKTDTVLNGECKLN